MIKAEYIWLDGTAPTAQIRSKTKILENSENLPVWGFDGSSTNQAAGTASDCVLNPVFACPDPVRTGDNILVLCEVMNVDGTPHESNSRNDCDITASVYKEHDCLFGLEQEYTMMVPHNRGELVPLGFVAALKEGNDILPQGPYYCSVGSGLAIGRQLAESHLDACLEAGLKISGINAEVMPGQWEFQVGPAGPLEVSDHLVIARWLLHRLAENYAIAVSFDGKPANGDWNGAGCHTNFSTAQMRESYDACINACEALSKNPNVHVSKYGEGIEQRLTGQHETCSHEEFRYGVSDRAASVRIPWQVEKDNKGYIEDRRPNANCDPYIVTSVMVNTICEAEVLRVSDNHANAPAY